MLVVSLVLATLFLVSYRIAEAITIDEVTKTAEEGSFEGLKRSQTNAKPKADTYTTKGIRASLIEEFGENHVMVAIASCESRLRQFDKDGKVLRGIVNNKDVGVFQINEYYHLTTAEKNGIDLYSLQGNIKYAKMLYERNGTRDWNASKSMWSKGECKTV